MDINKIKDLINLVESTGITGLSVEEGETKIEIKKQPDGSIFAAPMAIASQPASAPVKKTESAAPAQETHGLAAVKAPMTGTFYAAASPDLPPYIKVGDRINVGQPVCIVEAMKTFNEIESEVSGIVEKILVRNQEPVEFGQALILVKEA